MNINAATITYESESKILTMAPQSQTLKFCELTPPPPAVAVAARRCGGMMKSLVSLFADFKYSASSSNRIHPSTSPDSPSFSAYQTQQL